jgi:hypothetical protein
MWFNQGGVREIYVVQPGRCEGDICGSTREGKVNTVGFLLTHEYYVRIPCVRVYKADCWGIAGSKGTLFIYILFIERGF